MTVMLQLNQADNEFNILLPLVFGSMVTIIGSILLLTCWLLYRFIGKSNSGRVAVILSQAFISLVGTAIIGILAFGFAFGMKSVLSIF